MSKERQKRYRDRKKGVTNDSVTVENVTPGDDENVTQYPQIIYDITDPVKRDKLIRICNSLREHKMLDKVWYGLGGLNTKDVDNYLSATSKPA